MKKLSAREYLKQLEVLDMQINDDIATLSDMKMNVCSAGGIDYSRDKVQTSPVGDDYYIRNIKPNTKKGLKAS